MDNRRLGIGKISDGSADFLPQDCATSGYKRVIHNPITWRYLQNVYIDTVDDEQSQKYVNLRKELTSYSGFNVDVVVKDVGHRGRSVYAAEPIAKGTQVWESGHLVEFHTPQELLKFLGKLGHDLQCDALLWAYVAKGKGYLSLALDPASFVNHGENDAVTNLDKDCYAIRDIDMGEELLEDYSHFIGFKGVKWFHKIRGVAWKEDGSADRAHSTDEYNLLGAPKMWGIGSNHRGIDPVWLGVALLLGVATFVSLKSFRPSRLFKKQKDGI